MINISCPRCGIRLRVPEDKVSRWRKCPNCQKTLIAGEALAQQPNSVPLLTSAVPQGKTPKKLAIIGGLFLLLMALLALNGPKTPVVPPYSFGRTILAGRGSLAPGPQMTRYRENLSRAL
jgi:hypothetical protein